MTDLGEISKFIVRGSAIYHFVMGMFCIVSLKSLGRLSSFLYNLKVPKEVDPRFEYGLRPLGAFALVYSAWSVRAGWYSHPDELIFFKICFAILLLMRSWFRFYYRSLFWEAFEVSWSRSRWNCFFNLILSAVLILSVLYR
jgi:hypothetical protein